MGDTLGRLGERAMIIRYKIQTVEGVSLMVDSLAEAKEHVGIGATIEPMITFRSCPEHPSYEPANCPLCGTGAQISL
jgi:hypothetical protein